MRNVTAQGERGPQHALQEFKGDQRDLGLTQFCRPGSQLAQMGLEFGELEFVNTFLLPTNNPHIFIFLLRILQIPNSQAYSNNICLQCLG